MPEKRRLPSSGLERRVQPRKEDAWEPQPLPSDSGSGSEDDDSDAVSEEASHVRARRRDDSSDQDSDSTSESESEEDDDTPAEVDIASISFGALARAQASLPPSSRKSKKGTRSTDETPDEEQTKASKAAPRASKSSSKNAPPPKRSSKHAPLEQSSKRAVSRRRDIVAGDIPKRQTARDPRFDRWTAGARPIDEAKVRRAYSFLDEYRAKEIADMRAELKKTKAADRKEELKRRIMSMESQRKAAQRKDEETKLLADHRRAEKELVAQGKQPFYLKRGEQKKQLLMNRFASMSKSQVDKAIERKRKKVAGKEKQELDSWTRVRDRH